MNMAAPGLPAFLAGTSIPVVLSDLSDTHLGSWPGKLPELEHRPLELLWAEVVETLTWAETGNPLMGQHCRTQPWPK